MIKICEFCGKNHDGKYGSGRFCSAYCARQYSQKFITKESRERQIAALNDPDNRQKAKDNHYRTGYTAKRTRTTMIEGSPIQTSKRLGIIGEVATIKKFVDNGVSVYLPYGDSETADIVADFGGKLQKIQVKSTSAEIDNGNSVHFNLKTSKYILRDGKAVSNNKKYSEKDADYFSLYDYNKDAVFLVKNNGNMSSMTIRYKVNEDPKNFNNYCKNSKYHMAEDYDIDNILHNISNGYIEPIIFDVPYKVLDEEE